MSISSRAVPKLPASSCKVFLSTWSSQNCRRNSGNIVCAYARRLGLVVVDVCLKEQVGYRCLLELRQMVESQAPGAMAKLLRHLRDLSECATAGQAWAASISTCMSWSRAFHPATTSIGNHSDLRISSTACATRIEIATSAICDLKGQSLLL